VLHESEWYEQVSPEALYEFEYERIIGQHAPLLFPTYAYVPFKHLVQSEEGAAVPDALLAHERYREWWVVEAEMAHHSFEGHVRPQVQTLSRARYGEDVALALHAGAPRLDIDRLRSMVKGLPPRVLVIVNAPRPAWATELRRYDAVVAVLEVFRSRHNRHLYRLNGETPGETSRQSSKCTVDLQRFLRVHQPGVLPVADGERMLVQLAGGLTEWRRMDTADTVYLTTRQPITLTVRREYDLVEREDGSYELL
jgi:hypothetical protein